MNNGIQVIYPRTKYKNLNQAMCEVVQNHIIEFMNFAKEPIQENFTYTFDISHDEYTYQDYLSIVFYISSYTGGAHPSHQIYSIVYDISNSYMKNFLRLISSVQRGYSKDVGQTAQLSVKDSLRSVRCSLFMHGRPHGLP